MHPTGLVNENASSNPLLIKNHQFHIPDLDPKGAHGKGGFSAWITYKRGHTNVASTTKFPTPLTSDTKPWPVHQLLQTMS
jgi:hypothetical protein